MDVLTSKQKRNDYDSLSRYLPFSYYYHTLDDKFVYGLTGNILNNVEYVAHTLKDSDTLESLAFKYYGRPDYFWIIADFNRIKDPFIPLLDSFGVIKVPNLGQISFEVR
jgi:nucleoid-associated protein YgaU